MNTNAIKGVAKKAIFKVKKASPDILLVVGIGAVIGGTIVACKQTVKAREVLDNLEKELNDVDLALEAEEAPEYTEEVAVSDRKILKAEAARDLIKTYAPSVLIISSGIICIVYGHKILKDRNIALMSAYTALDTAYRNVIKEGSSSEEKASAKTSEDDVIPPGMEKTEDFSPYARYFDQNSRNFKHNAEYNYAFLKGIEHAANMQFQGNGHLFLNEVYDMLDIPRSPAGAVVGWLKGMGDDYIDFGLAHGEDSEIRDFINGYDQFVWLDFNVDGVIYDKI